MAGRCNYRSESTAYEGLKRNFVRPRFAFAFAIFIGVIVGTFSSVYTAAPIVLWWSRIKGKSLHREVKESELTATPALQSKSS